jgi:hypothetical protein
MRPIATLTSSVSIYSEIIMVFLYVSSNFLPEGKLLKQSCEVCYTVVNTGQYDFYYPCLFIVFIIETKIIIFITLLLM